MHLPSGMLCLVFLSYSIVLCSATVDRILEMSFKMLPNFVKDEKKQEMYKGALLASKDCLTPVATKAGEDTIEKFIEAMLPMGVDCGMKTDGIDSLHERRNAYGRCFHEKTDEFLSSRSQQDKDAFMETRNCFKEIFGDF